MPTSSKILSIKKIKYVIVDSRVLKGGGGGGVFC